MPPDAIDSARKKRRELHDAMVDLELTLAQPTGAAGWSTRLREDAAAVRDALAAHNTATEAADGILSEMVERAPRLDKRVEALRAEHPVLLEAADALVVTAQALVATADPLGGGEQDPDIGRTQALDLLGALARHRQRGADLVYDAFDIDIGGQA